MDRWHIKNIEAHRCDVWQKGFHVGEGAVARWVGWGGPRKKLVPGGVTRSLTIDPEMQLPEVARGEREVGISRDQGDDLVRQRILVYVRFCLCQFEQACGLVGQALAICPFCPLCRLL